MKTPLADRVRPTDIANVVGQHHLLDDGKILRRIIESGEIPNLIFYGPSGVGKTTVANIIAKKSGKTLYRLNATTASTSDLKEIIASRSDLENQNIINFVDNEGKAEYLIKNIQDSALENYKNRLDNDIHRFSCVPNMSDSEFSNNSSGVALSYKLMSLENLVGVKEAKFRKGLLRRLELMCNFLKIKTNSEMSYMEIQPIFTRNKPYNDTEIADTMQKLTGILSEETILALSPYVDDVASELERKKNEASALYEDNYSELGAINEKE